MPVFEGNWADAQTGFALVWKSAGYPGAEHRMPACCAAMRGAMGPSDFIVEQPPGGEVVEPVGLPCLVERRQFPRPGGPHEVAPRRDDQVDLRETDAEILADQVRSQELMTAYNATSPGEGERPLW